MITLRELAMQTQEFRRKHLAAAIALALSVYGTNAAAADVQINTPPGGNFVVKDNAGATTLLQVQGSGPVTIPALPGAG